MLRVDPGHDRDHDRRAQRAAAFLLQSFRGRIRLALRQRLGEHLA